MLERHREKASLIAHNMQQVQAFWDLCLCTVTGTMTCLFFSQDNNNHHQDPTENTGDYRNFLMWEVKISVFKYLYLLHNFLLNNKTILYCFIHACLLAA